MKNIIILSFLSLWSMDNKKGAPSFYKTVEGFINDGWNVILINPISSTGNCPKIDGLIQVNFKPRFDSLRKIRKIGFLSRVLHNIHGSVRLYNLGKKVLKSIKHDVIIYAYEVDSVKAGKKLSKNYKLPFITRFQGTILAPIENNWINRIRYYPHFSALKTQADITIMTDDGTLGNKVLNDLNNRSDKVFFWRNGVDIDFNRQKDDYMIRSIKEKYNISSEDKLIITVSRLATWKKVNRAIEALATVLLMRNDCKLIIVGDGDERSNLISLSERLNITSNVIFTGAVPQSDIKNYLDIADIFMSLYDLSNVGNPLMEAMACGKPIITLDVGDTSKLIQNGINGILLDISELDKIPKSINKILDDDLFAKMLGEKANEYAKEHFWTWNDRINAELQVVNMLREN